MFLHGTSAFPLTDSALQSWLQLIHSFHFRARGGEGLTVRQETKQRGTVYWCAYRRDHGKLRKKYLGQAEKVTLALLEAATRAFITSPKPEPEPIRQPPRQPTFTFTNTRASALAIFGCAALPTKAALLAKYRALSKQYHPDTGGLHQDMVAINLAYDYLKRYLR